MSGFSFVAIFSLVRSQQAMNQVREGMLRGLFDAPSNSVPGIVARLRPQVDDEVLRRLRNKWQKNENGNVIDRMRAGIALLAFDPKSVNIDQLREGMLDTTIKPEEFLMLRNSLAESLPDQGKQFSLNLWGRVEASDAPEGESLRTLAMLAKFDDQNPDWTKWRNYIVEKMLQENSLQLESLIEAFEPVKKTLHNPLREVFRGQRFKGKEDVAAVILDSYESADGGGRLDLLADATPTQFAVLWPKLEKANREKVCESLRNELSRSLTASWKDEPLDPHWVEPSPELREKIKVAEGFIEDRAGFALCQTLPLAASEAIVDELRRCGYRPLCYRPYATARGVQVASVWRRDRVDWQWTQGISATDLIDMDKTWQDKGYVPLDVTGYLEESAGEKRGALCGRVDATG